LYILILTILNIFFIQEKDIADFNINTIYKTLSKSGIDKKFIKSIVLPDWWDDSIAETKAGFLQTIDIISNNLGINLAGLLSNSETINLKGSAIIKFKTAKNVEIPESSIWPRSLALRISELIEEVLMIEFQSLPTNASDIREEIIGNYKMISLETVLDYLWTHGIPVIYISEFPTSMNKMDGMIIDLFNRPIIIVSKTRKHDAWLLFIIAHELGHFIKGHLNQSENIIYDTNIETEQDDEEKQANEFALEFLVGSTSPKFNIPNNFSSAFKLFNIVNKIGKELKLDPGIITLNFAYLTKNWALAGQTLNIIAPNADAVGKIKNRMKRHLNIEKTSEENADFLQRITSIAGENLEAIP